MRLINIETLQLEEFFGDQIPEYAILSHTWGMPKDEVSFEDMNAKAFKHKAGYQKILYLCQQASKDGLLWAWCDTCCINKDSSAELSEAINSMFQWYKNAKVCYAYLVDVFGSGTYDSIKPSKYRVPQQFHTSRWFSRGWTLQELLAPENVIFFSSDWIYIGKKQDLYHPIRAITGINRGALQWPWTIFSYSIATRLSWASRRKTSRPEDRAYSLLGILDIPLPLLYGESQNAFKRLQMELVKLSDDESLFAHSGLNVLAEDPADFALSADTYALPRSTEHKPYSITNMGLSIEIPLLPLKTQNEARSFKCLGVLNCHHGQGYKHFLAIPLQETSLPGTLLRSPGPVQLLEESLVKEAKKTSVMIRFEPLQDSKITYLPEYRGISRKEYKLNLFVCTSSVPWQYRKNRVTLHLNPKREVEYEIAVHEFQGKSPGVSFRISVIFELSGANAGLLISTQLEHESLLFHGPDGLFKAWEDESKPTKEELQIMGQNGQTRKVTAEIARETRLNEPVWVFSVDVSAKVTSTSPASRPGET